MSRYDEELKQGFTEFEGDQATDAGLSPQVKIGDLTWPCTKSTRKVGRVHVIGGVQFTYDFTVHIRTDAIADDTTTVYSDVDDPIPGRTTVIIDGSTYRVEFVDFGHNAFVALFLKDPNS
jgi:hypothetical protein